MSTKKQEAEIAEMNRWVATANSNTLLSFNHIAMNLAREKKTNIDHAKVLAYRRMKKKGMI